MLSPPIYKARTVPTLNRTVFQNFRPGGDDYSMQNCRKNSRNIPTILETTVFFAFSVFMQNRTKITYPESVMAETRPEIVDISRMLFYMEGFRQNCTNPVRISRNGI
jgi:hypothetical protein